MPSDIMEATRILMDGAHAQRQRRAAVDASVGLPISPDRARMLLFLLKTPAAVRAHVEAALAAGKDP
jgi:hypothetical protein